MKYLIRFCLVFSTLSSVGLSAQLSTTRDTLSGTPLTINMDQKILNTLEDLENKCAVEVATREDSKDSRSSNPVRVAPNRPLSKAEICRDNPRILGYKIQVSVVKSNQEANEVKAFFRRRFPNIKVETDASLRPNYKILAGSYVSRQSASSDLARIRAQFKSATAVQYRVFCEEAK